MFPCRYKAPRMHTPAEVCEYRPPADSAVDIFLWLIDIVDLNATSPDMYASAKNCYLDSYARLNQRTPGLLIDWTESMHFFCVLLKLLPATAADFRDAAWVRAQGLLIDEKLERLQDLITALDTVARRWADLPKTAPELRRYLDFLWWRCRHFCRHVFHHCEPGFMAHSDAQFKLMPKYTYAMASRYYWMEQFIRQRFAWYPPSLRQAPAATKALAFLDGNLARFVDQRQFRKDLAALLWRRVVMHPGDKDIAEYAMRGDKLSCYSALYKRRPAALMKMLQDSFVYGSDWSGRSQEYVRLLAADFYFRSVYGFPFCQRCVCFEDSVHRHKKALEFPRAPVILDIDGGFQVRLPDKRNIYCDHFHQAFHVFLEHATTLGDFDFGDVKATVAAADAAAVVLYE